MPKKSITEIDAMKAIDEAMTPLDEETRQRVMSWAESKFGDQTQRQFGSSALPVQHPVHHGENQTAKDIKTFLAQKQPSSFYERVACLAYYLEKVEGKSDVKTKDITLGNTNARLSKMSNPALFVKHATNTYGFLTSLARGKFGVSTRGEALVGALPDREAVKAALAQHPFGKGKKGKRKKTAQK
jgi:hypothetical protein